MNQFKSVALSVLSDDDQTFLEGVTLDARRANAFLESSPNNLEDILSFALMGDRLGLYGEGGPRGPRVKEILRQVYSRPPTERPGERGFLVLGDDVEPQYFDYFLDVKDRFDLVAAANEGRVAIITTNYDINVESALYAAHLQAELPFEYESLDTGFESHHDALVRSRLGPGAYSRRLSVPVYKLHGSVNWFEDSESVTIGDAVVEESYRRPVPVTTLARFTTDLDPIIVPPTFLKPDLDSVLRGIWEGAAKALRTAEEVVFVGYSFPPSDVEMRYFLARSLADNTRLRQIEVVDPNADAIVARLRNPESRFGSHFKSLLSPFANSWTKYSVRKR